MFYQRRKSDGAARTCIESQRSRRDDQKVGSQAGTGPDQSKARQYNRDPGRRVLHAL